MSLCHHRGFRGAGFLPVPRERGFAAISTVRRTGALSQACRPRVYFHRRFDARPPTKMAGRMYNEGHRLTDPDFAEVRPPGFAGFLMTLLTADKAGVAGSDHGGGADLTARTMRQNGFDFDIRNPCFSDTGAALRSHDVASSRRLRPRSRGAENSVRRPTRFTIMGLPARCPLAMRGRFRGGANRRSSGRAEPTPFDAADPRGEGLIGVRAGTSGIR